MGTPHKHAKVIKAWADGAKIQYYFRGGFQQEWRNTMYPDWNDPYVEYRVKPETKKYRVALFNSGVYVTESQDVANRWEHNQHFKRWLSDWVEYEV